MIDGRRPESPQEEADPPPEEQAEGTGARKRLGKLSLHPLTFEEAVDELLRVKLDREDMREARGKPGGQEVRKATKAPSKA